MIKRFNIHEWKRSRKIINEDDKKAINEDGGTYETTIFFQDAGDSFYVSIVDNQGEKQHETFTDIKLAYNYIIKYLSRWDLN